jgi:adenylylsulfate kinase
MAAQEPRVDRSDCMEHVLLITGSMGAGKTSTLYEASDLLIERGIVHAAIDLDSLGVGHLDGAARAEVALRNLAAVCANYASAGVTRLLAAGAIETRAELEQIQQAARAGATLVCRLRATPEVMEKRIAGRESGIFAGRYLARVRVLDEILAAAALEDFSIDTTNARITGVAEELLNRPAWIRVG